MEKPTSLQRALFGRAAVLFLLGMLTGLWAGVALSEGKALGIHLDPPKHERLVIGAHMNGLIGCFWLLGVAFTLPHVGTDERGRRRLAFLTTVATYGAWASALLASLLDVRGLTFLGESKNDFIAGLFIVAVVIPTLAASVLWARGLLRGAPAE
jgi:hydroxylaminobenzene mutase